MVYTVQYLVHWIIRLDRMYGNTSNMDRRPMFIEFAKYRDWGNFAVSMGRPQATRLSASLNLTIGTLPLDPAGAHKGSCFA